MTKGIFALIFTVLISGSSFAVELEDVVATTKLGKIEVKALENGMTLYVFDPDQGSLPTCKGDCAEVWPPILLTEKESTELSQKHLSFTKRANNKLQLTFKGRPVYTFFADRNPGEAKGDGLGGVWHVIPTNP